MKKQIIKIGISTFLVFILFSIITYGSFSQEVNEEKVTSGSRDITTITVNTWVYIEGGLINFQSPQYYLLPMKISMNRTKLLPGQSYINSSGDTIYNQPGQPYNMIPWNYFGNEGDAYDSHGDPFPGTANYPLTVIDWILVSLRTAPDAAPVCRKAALLHNDGHVEFTDGAFACEELDEYDAYYIVIEHRNHLIVMTPQPIPVIDGSIIYDFRYTQSYIDDPFLYGYVGQRELLPELPGKYAMHAGNGCQVICGSTPGDINMEDRRYWERQNRGLGYQVGDFNLNGDCNYNDRIIWENNNGFFTSVP